MRTQHFNIFNTGTESFFTPGTQLANIARVKPDAPAVIYVSPENKETVMTWQELHELSNRIAWYLLDQGIGPGKSVLAALPNIPTHIALAFGIWKTGACYVPVSNRAPQRLSHPTAADALSSTHTRSTPLHPAYFSSISGRVSTGSRRPAHSAPKIAAASSRTHVQRPHRRIQIPPNAPFYGLFGPPITFFQKK